MMSVRSIKRGASKRVDKGVSQNGSLLSGGDLIKCI